MHLPSARAPRQDLAARIGHTAGRRLPGRPGALAVLLLAVLAGIAWLALGAAGRSGAGPSLLLAQPLASLPDLGDYAWNPLARAQGVAVLLWLGAVEGLGWLAWPLTATVCRWLPDRGYPLSKSLALVLVGWLVWLAASLHVAPFTVWSILGAAGLLGGVSALLWRRRAGALRATLAAQWRMVLAWEGLFLGAAGGYLGLRLLDPDLWRVVQGGEHPMDFGFLNAILRSPWMPPYDPFFAGGYINYYYYGQFLVACLIKLTGVAPAVGFNLALATLYGLLVVGVASVVYNAVLSLRRAPRRRAAFAWGLGGAALVALAGNLQGGLQVWSMLAPGLYQPLLDLFHGWGLTTPALSVQFTSFDYWPVSRIVPRTINEFPYWIFLHGELHAHVIALPFTAAVLSLALNLFLGSGRGALPAGARAPLRGMLILWGPASDDAALRLAVTALALGALAVINTWDFVTYGGVLLAVALVARRPQARDQGGRRERAALSWPSVILGAGLLVLLALAAYAPFFAAFKAFYNQVRPLIDGVNGMRRTRLAEWLVIWGLFAFLTASYVGVGWWRWWQAGRPGRGMLPRAAGLTLLAGSALLVLGCLAAREWLLAWLVGLLGALLALLLITDSPPGSLFAGLLLAAALAATLGVELFYVADFLQATEWYRMNTVFKFYMQAWLLFGAGGAIALATLLGRRPRASRAPPGALHRLGWVLWAAALGVLLGAAGVFAVLGTRSHLDGRFAVRPPGLTLDGMAFLAGNTFTYGALTNTVTVHLADDLGAYDWLLAHAQGLPVVATASTAPDPEGMFVATYTGLPVVVGSMHQEEQRYPEEVAARRADMTELYRTPDSARALALLRKYDVRYLYVGAYERWLAHDAPAGLAKFAGLVGTALDVAYQNPGVTIYRVRAPPG